MNIVLQHQSWPIEKFIEYANNPRKNDHAVDKIAQAIEYFGFRIPIVAKSDGTVVDGHLRLKAARQLGMTNLPVVLADDMTDEQIKAFRISVNKMAELADWDDDLLRNELQDLQAIEFDMALLGFDDDFLNHILDDDQHPNDDNKPEPEIKVSLSDRFMIAPFSVISARDGWWMGRKRAWLALGITSEIGRGEVGMANQNGLNKIMAEKHPRLLLSKGASTDFYRLKRLKESELGRRLTNAEYTAYYESETKAAYNSGTSIFDPVLCEIAYRWFSPPQALIIDPFAGGSVRGIVAAKLNRRYIGIDLRAEQIEANKMNWQAIQGGALTDVNAQTDPLWLTDDSHNIDHILAGHEADFIFSCPPYAH